MGIDIKVHIELTSAQKRIIRAGVVTGSVIAAVGLGLAIAAPHQWASNDPLKATDLNGLNVVTYTSDGGTSSFSVGATKYCGQSPTTSTGTASYGGQVGYAAMKKLCEVATGCSSTAHMCSGDELARSVAIGDNPPLNSAGGWYESGASSPGGQSPIIGDCQGWMLTNSNFQGAVWVNNPGNSQNGPSSGGCNTSNYVFCCD
jgi:hypothetical protein